MGEEIDRRTSRKRSLEEPTGKDRKYFRVAECLNVKWQWIAWGIVLSVRPGYL